MCVVLPPPPKQQQQQQQPQHPINCQNWDLNVRSKDLNQLAASQYELPKQLSDWTTRDHKKHRESLTGFKHAKGHK
jgi:hypothetical protein